jgi:acetyl-CoA carboxylase biotin carboxyl carrier protein
MDATFIEALIGILKKTGLAEIEVEEAGLRLTLRASASDARRPAQSPDDASGPLILRAPMAGTFYRAPTPGAAPFVAEGDRIADGQTLALLEAMKMLSPLEADGAATVRRIHVENGAVVARGDPLFTLEPEA